MFVVGSVPAMQSNVPTLEALIPAIASEFPHLSLEDRLRAIRAHIPGRIAFTTSFGIEDQAIAHALFTQALDIDVVTLDTGRLFPETYQLWSDTEERYGARIRGIVPATSEVEALIAAQGINGFRSSVDARHACCNVRKVAPLGRALEGATGWITGMRGDQSAARSGIASVAIDRDRNIVKLSPLFDWSRDAVVDYVLANRIPCNPLHDRGFLSIGCAPCTRAIKPGEPERAGRWWWEHDQKKECGLHNRPARVAAA